MKRLLSVNRIVGLCFAIVVMGLSVPASAKCSDSKVANYAKDGRTVSWIAEKCDMEEDDVSEVIASKAAPATSGSNQVQGGGLPAGAPVGQCGCWGPAHPSQQQPHPQCSSGYAHPQMCNAMCSAGGMAWQGVCS
jgi:hypothetical protein